MPRPWGYLSRGIPETDLGRVNFADLGGWAGDFITTVGDWNRHGDDYPDAYTFARSVIGARVGGYTWGLGDLIEDVDGFGLAYNLKYETDKFLPDVIDERYTSADPSIFNWATRFKSFYFGRFGEDPANLESAAASLFVDEDPEIAVFVEILLTAKGYNPFAVLDRTVQDIARGFKDVILEWVQNENDRDYSS